MKDFLLVPFSFFIFFRASFVFGVYVRDEEPSAKPPLQVEELPWLAFFDGKSKSSSDDFGRRGRSQVQGKNLDLVSHSTLCPPGETGQFAYPPDCKRFINCWKGRGSIQVCAPGTLFNAETLECDFPGKVKCEDGFGGFGEVLPMVTGERYVRFPQQRPAIAHNPRIARKNQNEQSKPGDPHPGRPAVFSPPHLQPPSRSGNHPQGRQGRPQCALGATGLYPHPYDCTKFLKCWSGNTFIQNCGPGTFFNPLISACDHPRNVPCAHEGDFQQGPPGDAEIGAEDVQVPEESVQYEQYQDVNLGVKTPAGKGGKKTVKQDAEAPSYDVDPPMGTSTPKTEADDMEPAGASRGQTPSTHRNPKLINIGSHPQTNQFSNAHAKQPASYLTPPQYDVYGNLIAFHSGNPTTLGVQPGQSAHPGSANAPKVRPHNPSDPFLINYPPQGPYSTPQPDDRQKPPKTNYYYGYMLNTKHPHQHQPHHPHHFHHPHPHPHHPHPGIPTWLQPPPFQPQFFPQYAPYHPFFSKADSAAASPQNPFAAPMHVMHVPYYPTYMSEGDPCSRAEGTSKQEPTAPKCDPATPFYGPSYNHPKLPFGHAPATHPLPAPGTAQRKPPDSTPQLQSPLAGQPANPRPSAPNPSESDFTPQLQLDLNLDKSRQPGFTHDVARPSASPHGANAQRPAYHPQAPANYPEQPQNPAQSPPPSVHNQIDNHHVPPQTPQYQPYLFYYYPLNSNLYPYYPDQNPHPQTPGSRPKPSAPAYDNPDEGQHALGGQHPQKPDGFYPTKQKESTQRTPVYAPPKDLPLPDSGSDVFATEPQPQEAATFPPFPGATLEPQTGAIKTATKTSRPPKEYLLGQIDVRTAEEEEDDAGPEDAESIPTTQPPTRKPAGEKVDETFVKGNANRPLYTHPDKYSQTPSGARDEDEQPPDQSTKKTIKLESDFHGHPRPKQSKRHHVKVKQTPPNGQVVRLRNGASHLDGYLEMKDGKSKWGLICDHSGQWGIAEATVACRELGFIRGAELSWQGYPVKSESEEVDVAVNGIRCNGTETSLSECEVARDEEQECEVGRNAVGVRCYDNLASHCQAGEILYNRHCYKLHGKENPDDPWIRTEEASEQCKKHGGKLVDITSQYENDFISEWLIKKHPDVTAVATGGIGISVLGRPMWLWEGTSDPMVYERWWSGWSGDQDIPKGSINGPLCIVLRKTFSCVDDEEGQKTAESRKDEETCSADYFFWDVEDCGKLRTSVFICERPMDDIGCVVGNGESYVGTANTTASGSPCLPWDHPKAVEGLARRGSAQERSSRLRGHNYCRNLGDPDRHPWCFVEGRGNSEYCAIPQCWDSGSYSRSSGSWSSCDANHFECKPGECIRNEWVCDGQKDCVNGRDEETCKVFLQEFRAERNKKMDGKGNERWANVKENTCAKLCLEQKKFKCRSFSYNLKDRDCLLSEGNVGLWGQVVAAKGWVYHERSSESVECRMEKGLFGCGSGKCVNISNVCDGKRNCEDGSDERDCGRLGYQIRLSGSGEKHKGRVEVKILGRWGVVCDDMFDMRDAEVVCRELGFRLGAAEVLKHSEFPVEKPLFLVDHLDCRGNESSIRECSFPGWGKHNCGAEEVVGVSCRVAGMECPSGQWQCRGSKECISLAYLCDELKDCDDGTDEDKSMCESPTEIRLAGGPNETCGRLEMKRYNIWGTVCHDDFSSEAGQSVCSLLGFHGPSLVKKSAHFGPGNGPIWLDSGLCFINETDLEECTKHIGFQNNCKHDEDVSLICSRQESHQKSSAMKPVATSSAVDDDRRAEEKLRRVLISECSGKAKAKSRILEDRYEKVVGGSSVAREALPWQASVRVRSGSGKSVHWCGAVVISPYHVLTAGHCLRDYNKAAYFIRVGDYDTKVPDAHEEEFGIEHLFMHPEFGKGINLNNDIGLVKVKGEIPVGEHIKPACLAPSVDVYQPGTNCSVSGWGSVSANSAGYARTLRRAFVPVLEPSVCRAPYVYGDSLSEGMFCAGDLDGGVDSCQGDSGGPLMCQHEGREYLFGITSWGHGCGRANKPGVYTNVAHYAEWIQQKIQSSLS